MLRWVGWIICLDACGGFSGRKSVDSFIREVSVRQDRPGLSGDSSILFFFFQDGHSGDDGRSWGMVLRILCGGSARSGAGSPILPRKFDAWSFEDCVGFFERLWNWLQVILMTERRSRIAVGFFPATVAPISDDPFKFWGIYGLSGRISWRPLGMSREILEDDWVDWKMSSQPESTRIDPRRIWSDPWRCGWFDLVIIECHLLYIQ